MPPYSYNLANGYDPYNQQMFDFERTGSINPDGDPMAVATGTAALVGAGTSLLGGLFGAHKQAGAAKDALKAQEASSAEAIALEREKMAQEKAAWDQRQAQLAPYPQARASILAKYGVKIPTGSAGAGAPMGGSPMAQGGSVNPPQRMGGSSLSMLQGPQAQPIQMPQRSPLAQAAISQLSLSSLEQPDWSQRAWMGGR